MNEQEKRIADKILTDIETHQKNDWRDATTAAIASYRLFISAVAERVHTEAHKNASSGTES